LAAKKMVYSGAGPITRRKRAAQHFSEENRAAAAGTRRKSPDAANHTFRPGQIDEN
jgi:hypothetical protein